MNINSQNADSFRDTDLSTEAAALKAYEPLYTSPLLLSLLEYRRRMEFRNFGITKSWEDVGMAEIKEALRNVVGEEIRHFVTTYRGKARKLALQEIKRRLAVLLSKWEEEEARKEAGELPTIDGEGYGYIVNYAIDQGLEFGSDKPLSESEAKALDLTAGRILHTFETYIIYSFSVRPSSAFPDSTAMESLEAFTRAANERAAEEIDIQFDTLFGQKFEDNDRGLTTSFSGEVESFFYVEYVSFARRIYNHFAGSDSGKAAELNEFVESIKRDFREAYSEDIERAKNSRYNEYINI